MRSPTTEEIQTAIMRVEMEEIMGNYIHEYREGN